MTTDMKDTPIIDRKAIDRLKRLKRRRDFLQSRVDDGDANGRELSFDKGELSALVWAVEVIETTQALIKRETDKAKEITGETSDGYHTFNELYEYRLAYNAALFNEWALQGKYEVHKSKKHSDGDPCFDGTYFIVVAQLPTGQISNHYKLKYWDEFNLPERAKAAEYDGHTPKESLDRITQLKQQQGEGR